MSAHASSVGKSTLINYLCGEDRQVVGDTLEDGRGKHTTTARCLIPLPSGAVLVDTPGMREVQLWARDENLNHVFEEIDTLANDCRFRDCRHVAEPGCAVLDAVGTGEVAAERYKSYMKRNSHRTFLIEFEKLVAYTLYICLRMIWS